MKIVNIEKRIRCEMQNCKNMAEIRVEKEGFFRSSGFCICNECMKDMYLCFSKIIVPKSPNNMLNKKVKSKENLSEN